MGEAFRLGGFGMIPTTLVGLVLVAVAVQYARQPDRRRFQLVKNGSLLVAAISSLGFVAGLIKAYTSCGGVEAQDLGKVVIAGTGESLCNLGLGLLVLVVTWLAASIGAYRAGATSTGAAELTDPHTR